MDNGLWDSLDAVGKGIILWAAASGAIILLWGRGVRVYRWFGKKMDNLTWAFSEEHDHRIINDKLELLAAGIEDIKAEFKPNGGGSQHDKLEQLIEMAEFQRSFFHATLDTSNTAYFRTDEQGKMVWCNRSYTRMLGVTPAEVYQFGWVNVLDPNQPDGYRDRVVTMWLHAVNNKREFSETIHYIKSDGTQFSAHVIAFVIKSNLGMFGHFGEVTPIKDDQ
jgi:PAS domain S-box-containing protein